jgi:hypothetical protein
MSKVKGCGAIPTCRVSIDPGIVCPSILTSASISTFAPTLDVFIRDTTTSIFVLSEFMVTCDWETTIMGWGLDSGAGLGFEEGRLADGVEPLGLSMGVGILVEGFEIPIGFDSVSVEVDGSPDTTVKGPKGTSFGGHVITAKAKIATPIVVTADKKRG